MKKIAVILYGPPGAGKGTQANLLATKLHLLHFDTGHFLETEVHDPKRQHDPVIARERKLFDAGKLMTPSFVSRVVNTQIKKNARAGWGIILSGSPRTLFEAKASLPVLRKLYGKNVFVFVIDIPRAVTLARNSKRLICSECAAPLLTSFYPSKKPTQCPLCGGKLYRRILDNPKTIIIRLDEYENRTKPIFAYMHEEGVKLHKIDGRMPPYKVLKKIIRSVEKLKVVEEI